MGLKKLYKLYKLIIIVFFAFLVVSVKAQVSQRSFDAIQNPVGGGGYAKLGANASVYVCTYNTELTCNSGNYITVFSDNLLLHPITQPVRADLNGVYQYFIAAGTQVVEKVCFTASQCQSYYIYFSAGGGGISGSGTAGYLPVWTGATSLGNSVVTQTSTTPLNTLNFLDSSGATESQMLMPLGSDDVILGKNATSGSLGYGSDAVIIGNASAQRWGALTATTDAVQYPIVLGYGAGWGLLGGATSGYVYNPIFIGNSSGNSMLYNATSGGADNPICIGSNSCPYVEGSNVNDLIAIGSNSAEGLNSCQEVTSIGDNSASGCTNSINLVSIGFNSAATSTNTTNGIAIGNNSGEGWTGSTPGSNSEIIAIGTNAGAGVYDSANVIGIGAYVTDAVSSGGDDVFGYGYNSVEGIGAGSSEIIGVGTHVAATIGAGSDNIIGIGQNVGNNLGAASSDVIQIGHRSADNVGAVLTNAIAVGMQNNSASYQAVIGDPTITSLYLFGSHPASGGPYCLQQDSTGLITNTGAACGGGGGFSNPMTTLGDVIYGGASGAATRLAGNTTTTPQCLIQTGTGSASAAPVWGSCMSVGKGYAMGGEYTFTGPTGGDDAAAVQSAFNAGYTKVHLIGNTYNGVGCSYSSGWYSWQSTLVMKTGQWLYGDGSEITCIRHMFNTGPDILVAEPLGTGVGTFVYITDLYLDGNQTTESATGPVTVNGSPNEGIQTIYPTHDLHLMHVTVTNYAQNCIDVVGGWGYVADDVISEFCGGQGLQQSDQYVFQLTGTSSGAYSIGQAVTQATSGAAGVVTTNALTSASTAMLVVSNNATAFDATHVVSGGGQTFTPTASVAQVDHGFKLTNSKIQQNLGQQVLLYNIAYGEFTNSEFGFAAASKYGVRIVNGDHNQFNNIFFTGMASNASGCIDIGSQGATTDNSFNNIQCTTGSNSSYGLIFGNISEGNTCTNVNVNQAYTSPTLVPINFLGGVNRNICNPGRDGNRVTNSTSSTQRDISGNYYYWAATPTASGGYGDLSAKGATPLWAAYTNSNATNWPSATPLILPAAKIGLHIEFAVGAANVMYIQTAGTDKIQTPGSTVGGAGGHIQDTTIGDWANLRVATTGVWTVESYYGAGWTGN